jgi:hypothetical protein
MPATETRPASTSRRLASTVIETGRHTVKVWCRCAACGTQLGGAHFTDGRDLDWQKGLARAGAALAGQERVEGRVARLFCKGC